jgi:hypothetical protein
MTTQRNKKNPTVFSNNGIKNNVIIFFMQNSKRVLNNLLINLL